MEAPPAAITVRNLRLTCTYTPTQGGALRATVVAGVLIHRQLIELQQYCGNVWDRPGDPDAPKASMTPADELSSTRRTAVLSAVVQFATAHAWVVRRGFSSSRRVGAARQGGAEAHQRRRRYTSRAATRCAS